jgi:PAS domain S-box-containing protein
MKSPMRSFLNPTLTKRISHLTEEKNLLEQKVNITTSYLHEIATGNFNVELQSILASLPQQNDSTFTDTLIETNSKLNAYAKQEEERKWITTGMATFISSIQNSYRDKGELYERVLRFLIQYTGYNQGGLFIAKKNELEEDVLEMVACYAYGKKKLKEKQVAIGNGVLGQCFLEKETTIMTNIPDRYTEITSGLGESTPRNLVIVPLRYQEHVLGVLELASFQSINKTHIQFIEQVCENFSALLLNILNTEKVDTLYQEAEKKAKLLEERESSLRESIDALTFAQEEMKRHQVALDQQSKLLKFVVNNLPFPIFVKDRKGRYTLVNQAESELFGLTEEELLGKDDSHFVSSVAELDIIRSSDEHVMGEGKKLELPMQQFTTTQGKTHFFKTEKIPFKNEETGEYNLLGVSLDLTEKLQLHKKLEEALSATEKKELEKLATTLELIIQKIIYKTTLMQQGIGDDSKVINKLIVTGDDLLKKLLIGEHSIAQKIQSTWKELMAIIALTFQEKNRSAEDALTITIKLSELNDAFQSNFNPEEGNVSSFKRRHADAIA